jgi:hypothetical protein
MQHGNLRQKQDGCAANQGNHARHRQHRRTAGVVLSLCSKRANHTAITVGLLAPGASRIVEIRAQGYSQGQLAAARRLAP